MVKFYRAAIPAKWTAAIITRSANTSDKAYGTHLAYYVIV